MGTREDGLNENDDFAETMQRWGVNIPDSDIDASYIEEQEPESIHSAVTKWCAERFSRPSEAVTALQQGKNPKEAVASLFWYAYFNMQPFDITVNDWLDHYRADLDRYSSTEKEKTISMEFLTIYSDLAGVRDMLSTESFSCNVDRPLENYLEIMLAALRTVLVFSGKKEYDHNVTEIIANAFQIIRGGRIREAEAYKGNVLDDVLGYITSVACAVICNGFAYIESETKRDYDRDYISAFIAHVRAMEYLLKTDCLSAFCLPFAEQGYGFEGVIDVWENIKKQPAKVNNWPELRSGLALIEKAMWDEELESDPQCGPDKRPAFDYFPAQLQFCDSRMSQEDFNAQVKRERNEQHIKRMKMDYFGESWEYLEPDTRRSIISAEVEWYEAQQRGGQVKSAIEHYSTALETELHAIIFSKERVEKWLKGILVDKTDKGLRKELHLFSDTARTLTLNDMGKLLDYAGRNTGLKSPAQVLNESVSQLAVSEWKWFLVNENFTKFVRKVYRTRGIPVHRLNDSTVIDDIRNLRKKILGIDTSGYLPRLAAIKQESHLC